MVTAKDQGEEEIGRKFQSHLLGTKGSGGWAHNNVYIPNSKS